MSDVPVSAPSEWPDFWALVDARLEERLKEDREALERRISFLEADVRAVRRAVLQMAPDLRGIMVALVEAEGYFQTSEGRP